MATKLFVLAAAVLTVVNAGLAPIAPAYAGYAAPSVAVAAPSLTSQASNTYRSFGNLGQVSTYQKSIDTPFSSVRKSDVRVSNDALAYGAPAVAAAYHAPALAAAAYQSPVAATYQAPVAAYPAGPVAALRAAPAVAAPGSLIGVAYSAAPAVAHMTFNGYGISYAY